MVQAGVLESLKLASKSVSAIRERVNMHASPAEADKSFLLPLTSSILRAQESISEPDLEASPLTHKGTQSVRGKKKKKHLWNSLFTGSGWVEVASKHRSLLSCISASMLNQSSFRSDLGSVTRGNPPLVSRQVRLWSPWSQRLKVKGYRERVRKINFVKCRHAGRNHTETQLGKCNKITLYGNTLAAWQSFFLFFFLLSVTCKQLQESFSVVARSTISHFTDTQHTPSALHCGAINKSATQFNFCQNSRTVYASVCSLSLFHTAMSKWVPVFISHLHISPLFTVARRLFSGA